MKLSHLDLKLSHKGLILVAIPLAFEIIFVGVLIFALQRAEHEIRRSRHAATVLTESNGLLNNMINCGVSLYVYGTTGSERMLERFKEISQDIPKQIHELKILLRDSPNQAKSLERIKEVGNRSAELLHQGSEIIADSQGIKRVAQDREKLEQLWGDLTSELRNFHKELENSEQVDPQDEARSRMLVIYCLVVGIVVNVIIAVSLAVYFNRSTSKRLFVLMDNTDRLSRNHALNERIAGRDEIAVLDHVFHNMAEALAEAARRKQEIVSMVSHDLRTPLTSVQASLTLLSEGVLGALPGRAQKEITTAENNTNRLIGLINDLLDFEKMEAGQLRIECQKTDVLEVLQRSFEAVKAFADKQNVKIEVMDTDLDIYADGDRMIQVLVNLLSNSIKFSPPESTVTLQAVPYGENMAELRVIDRGRGIPESFRKHMFQRFQQVDQIGDAKKKKGTGLGLAICKSLVELHGGEIGVESEEGKGSTFWFRIPTEKPAESAALTKEQETAPNR